MSLPLELWVLKDEAVAACSIDDVSRIVPHPTQARDVFLLDTFPLRYIFLVGVLVGVDARERQTVFLLDDGSSDTLEITYNLPRPVPEWKLSSRPATSARPPILDRPLPTVGETVRIKAKVDHWKRTEFILEKRADIEKAHPNEEANHILFVRKLHQTVYPAFDMASLLASSSSRSFPASLPSQTSPPTSVQSGSRSFLHSPPSASTPSKRPFDHDPASERSLASTSFASTSSKYDSPSKSRYDRSCSLTFSDMPSSSQYSTATSRPSSPTGRSPPRLRDPRKLPSDTCDVAGLKSYIRDHMHRMVDERWKDSTSKAEFGPSSMAYPLSPWIGELRTLCSTSLPSSSYKGKGRQRPSTAASLSSVSFSFDTTSTDINLLPNSQPSDTSILSSFSASTSTSDASRPPPPFSLTDLLSAPFLLTYAQKVLKRTVKEREHLRRTAEKKAYVEAKSSATAAAIARSSKESSRWFDPKGKGKATSSVGGGEEPGAEIMGWRIDSQGRKRSTEKSLTSQLKDPAWVEGKVRRLMEFTLKEMLFAGDVVAVDRVPDWGQEGGGRSAKCAEDGADGGRTPRKGDGVPFSRVEKKNGGETAEEMYLPLTLPTIAPLLVQLLLQQPSPSSSRNALANQQRPQARSTSSSHPRLSSTFSASSSSSAPSRHHPSHPPASPLLSSTSSTSSIAARPPLASRLTLETLVKRLKALDGRWHFVSSGAIEPLLEDMEEERSVWGVVGVERPGEEKRWYIDR